MTYYYYLRQITTTAAAAVTTATTCYYYCYYIATTAATTATTSATTTTGLAGAVLGFLGMICRQQPQVCPSLQSGSRIALTTVAILIHCVMDRVMWHTAHLPCTRARVCGILFADSPTTLYLV